MRDRRDKIEDRSPAGRDWRDLAVLAAVVLAVAGVYAPMVATGRAIADSDDFLQYAARQEFLRKSVLVYGVFPLRSHFFGSGYPTLGDPEDPTLSPFAWCLLPFPTEVALKLRIYIAAILGALGAYLLARRALGYPAWGAAFSALLFPLGFWLPQRVASGNPTEVLPALVPLCLFLVLTAPRRPLRFVWLPLLLYAMMADGKQSFVSAVLFMTVICGLWCIPRLRGASKRQLIERLHPLIYLGVGLVAATLIGMMRILPAMEVISPKGGLLNLDLHFHVDTGQPRVPTLLQVMQGLLGLKGVIAGADTLYLGVLPVLLFVGGLALAWRRALVWWVAAFLFLWLLLGENAPINLLAALHKMPLGSTLDRPVKYFAPLLALSVSLGAGAVFGPMLAVRPRWLAHVVCATAVAAVMAGLVPHVVRMSSAPFVGQPPAAVSGKPDDFYSVQGKDLPRNRAEPVNANTFFNLRRNVGTVDWYTGIPLPENGQPRFFVDSDGREVLNLDWRGEAHFVKTVNRRRPNSSVAYFEPNRIRVNVDFAEADLLIINQNFHAGWRTDRGAIEEHEGLLAVRLDTPGQDVVTLRYRSRPFTRGLFISAFGLVALVAFVVMRWRGRLKILAPRATGRTMAAPARERCPLPAWLMAALVGGGVLLPLMPIGFVNWRAFHLVLEGNQRVAQNRLEEATDAYERAMRIDPSFEAARRGLVLCYRRRASLHVGRGEYLAAANVLRTGLESLPDNGDLMWRLGWLLASCPDPAGAEVRDGAEAQRLAERLVEASNRSDPTALDLLAAAYAEQGRFREAVHVMAQALRFVGPASPKTAAGMAERFRKYEAGQPHRMPAASDPR